MSPAAVPGPPADLADLPLLPGVEAAWHRRVEVDDADGVARTWHLLDGAPSVAGASRGTVVAVHGNPTWSYLWRATIRDAAAAGWRVVAADQLDMGFSERTGTRRRLERRVDDLLRLTDALGITGPDVDPDVPLVSLGHDWGGIVSAGWATAVRERGQRVSGVVLTNTAVHQPLTDAVSPVLRVVKSVGVREVVTETTAGFVRAMLASPWASGSGARLEPAVRAAYLAPYLTRARRSGVGAFVSDIPDTADHPSRPALDAVATGLSAIGADESVPTLVVWGAHDPVFSQRYLDDLRARLPRGDVHRVERAGHLVVEEADVAGIVTRWLLDRVPASASIPASASASAVIMDDHPSAGSGRGQQPMITEQGGAEVPRRAPQAASRPTPQPVDPPRAQDHVPMVAALYERAAGERGDDLAVVQLRDGGRPPEAVTWAQLARRVDETAAGLLDAGARPGQRISLLVTPGVDLTVMLYAALRVGLVAVVADAGLGVRGLERAIRGSAPTWLAAVHPAVGIAWVLGWPGRRIAVGASPGGPLVRRGALALASATELDAIEARGRAALLAARDRGETLLPHHLAGPGPDDDAAVIFTSGSTGPAKGVVYTHARMAAMARTFGATARVGPDRPLVAAFAPFALLGPALGATSAVPSTDVTKPATLTAAALADAAAAVGAKAAFASPAALANVVATAGDLTEAQRSALAGLDVLLSAGAPVDPAVLAAAGALTPNATARTPYGMTEALPTTDVSLAELLEAGAGDGVLVGAPVPGARLALAPLDDAGRPVGALTDAPGVTGEVLVSAAHTKDRYDQLWDVQRASAVDAGWHRTGDVGHLDARGRLWVEGRLAHVVVTDTGVVTPVGAEQRVQTLPAVSRAALVGVGPVGTQRCVVVLEVRGGSSREDAKPVAAGPAPLGLSTQVRAAASPVDVAAVLVVDVLPTDVRHRSKIDRARVGAWAEEVLAGRAKAGSAP